MNARTIQHPGIEIREIDMTEYTTTVTTNNAYVMGFADKGPIYDYSWITTQSEFISLYGQPQTEAEKYLFYAVQSILDNGGTPIVARMPYDNKQCKAYKALKIKYASVIDDPESKYGFTLLDWENTASFSSNANPSIDLERVGKYIHPEGFEGIYETLQHQDVAIQRPDGTTLDLTANDINQITYKDLLISLNNELGAEIDRANDTQNIESVQSLENIGHLIGYLDQSAHEDKSVSAFVKLPNFAGVSGQLQGLVENYAELVSSLTNYCVTKAEKLSGLTGLNVTSGEYYNKLFAPIANISGGTFESMQKELSGITSSYMMSGLISSFFNDDADVLNNLIYTKLTSDLSSISEDIDNSEPVNIARIKKAFGGVSAQFKEVSSLFSKFNLEIPSALTDWIDVASGITKIEEISGFPSYYGSAETVLNNIKDEFKNTDYYRISNATNTKNFFSEISKDYAGPSIDNGVYTSSIVSSSFDGTLSGFLPEMQTRIETAKAMYNTLKDYYGANDDAQIDAKIAELTSIQSYLNAFTTGHDKTVSGVLSAFSDAASMELKSKTLITSGLTGSLSSILTKYGESTYMGDVLACPSDLSEDVKELYEDDNYIFNTVYPNGCPSAWLEIFKLDLQYQKIDKLDGDYKHIIVNGEEPNDLLIPSGVISTNYLENKKNSSYISEKIHSATRLADLIADAKQKGNYDDIQKYEFLKETSDYLAAIYNNPHFKKFDDDNDKELYHQAILDAHLLTTPEINYKKAVYLDSRECELSNEQYDDLVTTNNFTKKDLTVNRYGDDIDDANFVIVDKQKSIVGGTGGNEGYFVTIVDPFDALKMQRMLVNPAAEITGQSQIDSVNKLKLRYYASESEYAWKNTFKDTINTLDALQRVKNADGIWVGEINKTVGKEQLLDVWSIPLKGAYYDETISKQIMGMFPQIPLTDVAGTIDSENPLCIIDKQYSSHIMVAVCRTVVNPSDGKIMVTVVEQFFGSIFNETNVQNGRDLFIGTVINANSNYIEFYKNNYIKPAFGDGYDPAPYNKTPVPQFYIKDSSDLNNACKMAGIDTDLYDVDNVYFNADGTKKPSCPPLVEKTYNDYIEDLRKSNIFVFNKKTTVLYNNHPYANFTSFSKKEAQKIIANTTGLFGQYAGTTENIGDNFILDMDRCIGFIKNIDDIPIYFVADAGLSTIAQFCDNVVWDQEANDGQGKWVTQSFDPDNDPDSEDRYITNYTDVSTWRKVVDKLDQISREIRRDCMTIIDAPRQLTLDGAAPKIRRSRPQNNWDDLIGDKLRFISGINSSYCAGYYNWLRTTDTFTGRALWLPPTTKIIGNFMYLNAINLPWLAPAGLSYGVLTGIHAISHNPSPNECDQIYLKSWNYVKQYPFDGFIVEGQKTTLTKNSAFNRINVRTLFLDLERYVYNVARGYKYQVNNSYIREQFVHTIKPKFEDYVIRHGLYDYRIICDDTNNTPETIDANELRCAIYLKPARLIEFIMIDFIAAKTGANFEEIVL